MKRNIITALVIIILAAAVAGAYLWHPWAPRLVQTKNLQLSQSQRTALEQQLKQAEQKLNNLSKDPANANEHFVAYMQVGAQQYALGLLADARRSYEAAAKLFPDNPTPWQELFPVEVDMQDYKAAETSINKALALNPHSLENWKNKIKLERDYLHIPGNQLEEIVKQGQQQVGEQNLLQ